MQKDKELFDSMRNIVILNSLHFSYPLPILMRVSYNTLIVKQNTSDYYKYSQLITIFVPHSFRLYLICHSFLTDYSLDFYTVPYGYLFRYSTDG